jgi:hypothetical protein
MRWTGRIGCELPVDQVGARCFQIARSREHIGAISLLGSLIGRRWILARHLKFYLGFWGALPIVCCDGSCSLPAEAGAAASGNGTGLSDCVRK